MKVNIDSSTVIVGGIAIAGVIWYVNNKRRLEMQTQNALNLVNPLSPDNLAYQGVNELGELITGDEDFSYGSWVYDNRNNPLGFGTARAFDFVRWLRGD